MRKFWKLLLPLTLISLVAAACGSGDSTGPTAAPTAATAPTSVPTAQPTPVAPPTATAQPISSGSLSVALQNMLPFELLMTNGTLRKYLDPLYDYIIGADSFGKLDQSGWATSWTVNADGSVHTLKGRDSIQFHNGDKASAEDVKVQLERMLADGYRGSSGPSLRASIASVAAPDEATAVIALKAPSVYWYASNLSRMGTGAAPSYLISGKYFKAVGEGEYNKNPVASGPYKVTKFTVGDGVVYDAIPRHWYLGVPRVKTLSFTQVGETNTRIALLETGSSDLVQIDRGVGTRLKGRQGITVHARDGSAVASYTMYEQWKQSYPGYGANPLADARIRRALNWYAIDRKAIVASFLHGFGKPTLDGPLTDFDPAFDAPLPVPEFSPAKGRALLAEAGYPNGFTMDLWSSTSGTLPEALEIMEAVAVYWEGIGIKVNRRPVEYAAFLKAQMAPDGFDKPTAYGMFFGGKSPTAGASAGLTHKASNTSSSNRDPELDRLASAWAAALTGSDYAARGRAYAKAAYEQAVAGNLFEAGDLFAGNSKIPASWQLGRAAYSYQIEIMAARR